MFACVGSFFGVFFLFSRHNTKEETEGLGDSWMCSMFSPCCLPTNFDREREDKSSGGLRKAGRKGGTRRVSPSLVISFSSSLYYFPRRIFPFLSCSLPAVCFLSLFPLSFEFLTTWDMTERERRPRMMERERDINKRTTERNRIPQSKNRELRVSLLSRTLCNTRQTKKEHVYPLSPCVHVIVTTDTQLQLVIHYWP